MLEWIETHGLIVTVLLTVCGWTFSTIVGSLPNAAELKVVRPNIDPLLLLIYSKALPQLQWLAGSAARSVESMRLTRYLKKP